MIQCLVIVMYNNLEVEPVIHVYNKLVNEL